MSTNPLAKLAIDYWYNAIAVAGLFILVISLTINLVNVDNNVVQLISLGAFFIGLGEWVNHPLQVELVAPTHNFPGGKLSGHPRNSSFIGVFFDLIGIALVVTGIYKIFN